ncbi:MAG: apolipoprotein N-acyltransferase [Bacteroidales bacterium]|nr:apolipoprotein N-acyltransferase [Bacteroidales bacterium]
MKKNKLLLYTVATGLLLIPSWYEWGHGLIMLIAFVPLLFVEDYLDNHKKTYRSFTAFLYAFVAFLIWNAGTTWWIFNASAVGMVVAFLYSTIAMSIVFWLFHISKRNLGPGFGYFALIIFWISFEHLYFKAEISWPWLTLGHGFAYNVRFIQWYDTTGVLGGSLWILLSNILIFLFIKKLVVAGNQNSLKGVGLLAVLIVIIPIIISLTKFYTYEEKSKPVDVVIIQPNIDPYKKFVDIPSVEQTRNQLNAALPLADEHVDYFVAPETSINNNIWLDQLDYVPDIRLIKSFLKKYPKAKYVVGITSYKRYEPGEKLSVTARPLTGTEYYYDSYNSAIQIDSTGKIPVYHKSQLVVGVEKMPYTKYLKFLKNLTLRLGGTFRSHGTQEFRENFISPQDSISIAPVICWESVFGEFVSDYIKKGANFIFVITNDGWWGNTPGHRQHNSLSCIRAIETRRSVARSANTGISCFINQRGEVGKKLTWWKYGAIRDTINANDKITFYVKHGNYIAHIAMFMAALVLLMTMVRGITRKS